MVTACFSFVNAIIEQSQFYGTSFVHSPFQHGLPNPSGTTITILASNPEVSGEFYAVNNRGLFILLIQAFHGEDFDIQWPKEYLLQSPGVIVVSKKK
jgi:hypothetical protein